MSKLWGGRFSDPADDVFARINASLGIDCRLLAVDIAAARAYLAALEEAGVLDSEETRRLDGALGEVLTEAEQNPEQLREAIQAGVEDVHSYVESEVIARVGDLGLKLNTGRSRNDQIATDLRLWQRDAVDGILEGLDAVREALLDLAEANAGVVIPGYTHLQRAQPVLFAHYLLAYFEMLSRDADRFHRVRAVTNVCPLGSAALAGSNYPLNRQRVAERLGFEKLSANSMDAVSDRDFIAEFTSAAALLMVHLSRLAEDWILYASSEFGFIRLSDRVSTGSSLLPQKRNPDGLELIRGKAAVVLGHNTAMLALLKGLPLTYNKDLQEDKRPLFDTAAAVLDSLQLARLTIANTSVLEERLRKAAAGAFLNATELADYLVVRGVPFRRAHELVGAVVSRAAAAETTLDELPLEVYREYSDRFDADLFERITLEASLAAKDIPGGTAPARVEEALRLARRRLEAGRMS